MTPEERDEIKQLFERRNGLNELAKIITADNTELYEKLVHDLGETGSKFQSWWDRMENKYQWCIAAVPGAAWAKKLFPELRASQAVEKLWGRSMRVPVR